MRLSDSLSPSCAFREPRRMCAWSRGRVAGGLLWEGCEDEMMEFVAGMMGRQEREEGRGRQLLDGIWAICAICQRETDHGLGLGQGSGVV